MPHPIEYAAAALEVRAVLTCNSAQPAPAGDTTLHVRSLASP
jgi:hypothetical protein